MKGTGIGKVLRMDRNERGPGGRTLIAYRVSLIALVAVAGFALGGVLHSQTTQVLGGRFVLLDSGGIQRGVVEVNASGEARIVLTGQNSQTPSAALGVDGDGNAYLQLRDGAGAERATLAVDADGATRLALLGGGSGAERAILGESADGSASLVLRDAAGRTRAVLGVGQDGAPALTFYDAEGNRISSTP